MNSSFSFKATALQCSLLLLFVLIYSASNAQSISFDINQGIQFEENKEMQMNRYSLDMAAYAKSIDLETYALAMHSEATAIFYDPNTHIFTVRIERRLHSGWDSNHWNNHFAALHQKHQNN